jgi:hypothetical protein
LLISHNVTFPFTLHSKHDCEGLYDSVLKQTRGIRAAVVDKDDKDDAGVTAERAEQDKDISDFRLAAVNYEPALGRELAKLDTVADAAAAVAKRVTKLFFRLTPELYDPVLDGKRCEFIWHCHFIFVSFFLFRWLPLHTNSLTI